MKYLFSIIIPTYKRKASLIRLLESLVSEMKLQYEIIIVEQVITNKKEFYQFAKEHNLNINYIFLHEASTPHAKNIGAVSAKGKYLIFFDDDVVVEKGVFDGYEKAFIKDRNHIVAGRVLTPGHPINPKSKNVGKISYFGKFSDDYTSDFKQQVDTVIGCNAGWEKEVFENVGGFDEQITMNGIREESDLSLRAKDMGYKIFFEPNATVIHLREETGGGRKSEGRLSWYYNFISNDTYFFLKYRPKWVVFIILLTRWEWFLRCMFGFGREVSIKSIATPLLGILYGFRKYNSWKRLQRRLKIGVDAGCLGIQDKRLKVGVYQVAKNLLIELAKIDNKNQYLLYSFYPINKKLMRELGPQMQNIVVSPSRGWTKLWLPLRLFRDRPDIFIGLSQSLPQRIPSNRYKTLLLMYDLAFEEYPQSYRDYSRISKITSLAVMSADKIITISE
ncbi:MAG TPA: glycosyltransferase, partial [Patescibacteria group bacterium]